MAIDQLGRYQLVDIRDRVRRLLDSVSMSVDPASGAESALVIQDQLISNTDILNQVNESLTGLYIEVAMAKPREFSTIVYISTKANVVGPYQFPSNMLGEPRWLKWRDPGVPFVNVRPENWRPMALVDDPNDTDIERTFQAPTWRYDGDGFRLNELVPSDNPEGIQVNYLVMPAELTKDTDVISIPIRYARVMQQAVIYDATFTLAYSKKKQVTTELAEKRQEWHTRLSGLVENARNVSSVQLIAPSRMVRMTFSGRIRRVRGFGGGWDRGW